MFIWCGHRLAVTKLITWHRLSEHDTSIIFTNSKSEDFKNDINIVCESLNKWFEANKLSLNFYKTHYIQFTTKNSRQIDLEISYANKLISKALDAKFLGIHVDITLKLYLN
jgi:hypothetical protein